MPKFFGSEVDRLKAIIRDLDERRQAALKERNDARQQLAAAPAWHDRPTVPGWWLSMRREGGRPESYALFREITELNMKHSSTDHFKLYRWYGPIPPTTEKGD